jgi:hypothetical protein
MGMTNFKAQITNEIQNSNTERTYAHKEITDFF